VSEQRTERRDAVVPKAPWHRPGSHHLGCDRRRAGDVVMLALAHGGSEIEIIKEDVVLVVQIEASAVHVRRTDQGNFCVERQRFGVKIQFDLFDGSGQKIGSAKDYQQVIEPKGEWKFRALAVTSKAASAKVASITEEK